MQHGHIEIFTRQLRQLLRMVEKIERESGGNTGLLQARLAPDMFPLVTQVEIAANFALRSCCPIAGREVIAPDTVIDDYDSLKTRLADVIAEVEALDDADHDMGVVINDMAGPKPVSMVAGEFLSRFAWPNFYFHISMVYAIARQAGIALGKGDFDGLHDYPPGFSFDD